MTSRFGLKNLFVTSRYIHPELLNNPPSGSQPILNSQTHSEGFGKASNTSDKGLYRKLQQRSPDKMESLQRQQIQQTVVNNFHYLMERFNDRLSASQLKLLHSDEADNPTKVMLAEMILDLVARVSRSILEDVTCVDIDTHVRPNLQNTIRESFGDYLGTGRSSKYLSRLLSEEVTQIVNSLLSATRDTVMPVSIAHITPPHRIDVMVRLICTMTKELEDEMTPSSHNQGNTLDSFIHITEAEDKSDQSGARSKTAGTNGNSNGTKTPNNVQDVLTNELSDIAVPFINDIPRCDCDLLLSNTAQESEGVRNYIRMFRRRATVNPQRYAPTHMREVTGKLKTFFAKQFAKLSLCRIVRQLRTELSPECLQCFADDIDSLLEGGESHRGGYAVDSVCPSLQDIINGKVLAFSGELNDVLYSYISDGLFSENHPAAFAREGSSPHNDIHKVINDKLWCFHGLLRWWLTSQAGVQCERVTLALKESAIVLTETHIDFVIEGTNFEPLKDSTPTATVEDPAPVQETTPVQAPASFRVLVEKLVSRTLKKQKVSTLRKKPSIIVDCVLERIWAKVKEEDFEINTETLLCLDKAIFKQLCKSWGNPERVLAAMTEEDPEVYDHIANAFKHHLKDPPKKRNTICRFFSCVGRVISKPFTAPFRRRVSPC
ncbi:hypothetical protein ABVT39_015255 [Epinephelus coioides]